MVKTSEKEVGRISTYFKDVGVAAIELTGDLKVGDTIHVKGHTTDFKQKVSSMQIDRKNVQSAKKKQHIGIKISDRVRPNDAVFLAK
ncbi:translation elongation factor-like protein [Candidatus Pacearchaeota archaeon]|nr:translation elongation factor-like protein [Candidatus Pacearchaeota archaeon]